MENSGLLQPLTSRTQMFTGNPEKSRPSHTTSTLPSVSAASLPAITTAYPTHTQFLVLPLGHLASAVPSSWELFSLSLVHQKTFYYSIKVPKEVSPLPGSPP